MVECQPEQHSGNESQGKPEEELQEMRKIEKYRERNKENLEKDCMTFYIGLPINTMTSEN